MSRQAFTLLKDKRGNTCALGAAGLALGFPYRAIQAQWNWITSDVVACPACAAAGLIPETVIVHLNDDHRWSRERIADWVASVEPQEAAEQIVRLTMGDEHVGGGVPVDSCAGGKS